jgi:hypothetical protein
MNSTSMGIVSIVLASNTQTSTEDTTHERAHVTARSRLSYRLLRNVDWWLFRLLRNVLLHLGVFVVLCFHSFIGV